VLTVVVDVALVEVDDAVAEDVAVDVDSMFIPPPHSQHASSCDLPKLAN
jgi:hypothetical protein